MILLLLLIFVATLALLIGAYLYANRRSLAAASIARSRLGGAQTVEPGWSLLKDDRVSDFEALNKLLAGKDWIESLRVRLDRAGTTIKPGSFVLLIAVSGLFGTFIGTQLNFALASLVFTALGWAAPFGWLRWRTGRRLRKFEQQLPDAIDMLVSAMRAGYSFQAATQFIGDEMPDPLGEEFGRFYDEQRLGIEVRQALLNLQSRVDSLDLKMFVTAVLIQRETGGNLSEVLSQLADLIRQRMAMKGHIETLVAEPKLSAKFLAVMPLVVFLLLGAVNPVFMRPLTNTGAGRLMLMMATISVLIGYWIMMRIADIDV